MTLTGQRVFEDADFILLKTPWFGLSHPVLARYVVYLKTRQLAVRVEGREKKFLLAVLGEMVKLGMTSQAIKGSGVFHDFCQAVPTRGMALWQVFFNQQRPQDLAKSYAQA